ncbi:hypothetical protein CEXT_565891 [Caerostris extrusa]|uniref:Uncharacterized protein n=1 Tax=Caerostris extrusa TaxID=172846 RepID=A0AAV4PCJ6_CAEEX|nr:hypothetical protein CEXT_565891 [Caerostris extrusa]
MDSNQTNQTVFLDFTLRYILSTVLKVSPKGGIERKRREIEIDFVVLKKEQYLKTIKKMKRKGKSIHFAKEILFFSTMRYFIEIEKKLKEVNGTFNMS